MTRIWTFLEGGVFNTFFSENGSPQDLEAFVEEAELGFLGAYQFLTQQTRNHIFTTLNIAIKAKQDGEAKYKGKEEDKEKDRAYYVLVLLLAVLYRLDTKKYSKFKELLKEVIEHEVLDIDAILTPNPNDSSEEMSEIIFISESVLADPLPDNFVNGISNKAIIKQGKISGDIDQIFKNFLGLQLLPKLPVGKKKTTSPTEQIFSKTYEKTAHAQAIKDIGKILSEPRFDAEKLKRLNIEFCDNTIKLIAGLAIYWLEAKKRSNKSKKDSKYEKIVFDSFF